MLAAATAVLVAVLGGCGLGGGAQAAPPGWQEREVGSLTLAHPEQWLDLPAEDVGGELWQAGVQDAVGEDATVQLLIGPDFSDDRAASGAADRLVAGAQIGIPFEGWTSEGRTEIEVPGATSAERWDFRYDGQDGAVVSGVWVFVADEEAGRAAAVQLTGTQLDEQVVFDVVRSLRFDAGADPVEGPERA